MGSVKKAGVDREVHATADQEVGATVLFLEVGESRQTSSVVGR
ncbi:MAG: hypothetical protein WB424_08655 [Terracidiphilus sp.]